MHFDIMAFFAKVVRSGGLYLENMCFYLLESSELGVREPGPDGCCGLQLIQYENKCVQRQKIEQSKSKFKGQRT